MAIAASSAAAQTVIGPGSRVRIVEPTHWEPHRAGSVVSTTADSALVAFEPDAVLGRQAVTDKVAQVRLEVFVATRRATIPGALLGGTFGLITGAMVGKRLDRVCYGTYYSPTHCEYNSGATNIMGAAGALLGAGIGALIGRRITRESWAPVLR